jgi:PiT family inorganic phosphate transporter
VRRAVAIVLWATAPGGSAFHQRSHALIAGISGAAIALQGGIGGIHFAEWIKVLYGLILSVGMGFCLGWLTVKSIEMLFRRANRKKPLRCFSTPDRRRRRHGLHARRSGRAEIHGRIHLGLFLAKGQSASRNL